jgi:3-oxo-5-alpha-steroid 4-dehydrogenase 1
MAALPHYPFTGNSTYDLALTLAFAWVAAVSIIAWFVPSPYGRFATAKFGLSLDPRLGWFLIELPATLSFLYFFLQGERRGERVPLVLFAMWLLHYSNRGFLFPLLMRVPRGQTASFSLMVVVIGWLATTMHGYLHATFFAGAGLGAHYTADWLSDPRFIIGASIYYLAMIGNVHSDAILRRLRSKEELESGTRVYRIPQGGLFRYVTNPSYLTELVAWAGWALATWSLAGVYIFALSAANLIPRAVSTHRWYRERFPDYPTARRILIPFLF